MRLLFFKAPWCTACHAIEKNVPQYAEHIDCDTDAETATRYGICSLPMFMAVKDDGTEIARMQSVNVTAVDRWFKAIIQEAAA